MFEHVNFYKANMSTYVRRLDSIVTFQANMAKAWSLDFSDYKHMFDPSHGEVRFSRDQDSKIMFLALINLIHLSPFKLQYILYVSGVI